MEVSYVMQLSQALLEAGDTIQESTQARHRYLAAQKDHEEAKETQGESKRRATGTTRARAAAPAALPQVAAMSHEGSPELPRRVVFFFCCERLSASMARSLHLSFICIPQSTRALDQGGVEPRQGVSPKALRPWTIPLRYSVG